MAKFNGVMMMEPPRFEDNIEATFTNGSTTNEKGFVGEKFNQIRDQDYCPGSGSFKMRKAKSMEIAAMNANNEKAKYFTHEEADALANACKRGDNNAVATLLGKSMFGGCEYNEIVIDLGFKLTGPKAMKCLAEGLSPDLEVLGLDLRGCNMLAEGAKELGKNLPKNCKKLTLCLQSNKIGDKGAIAIFESLPKDLTFLSLNTYGAVIGTEAAKVFAKNMPQKLKEFELDMCDGNVGDEGMIAISQSLPKTIERMWLHLKGNKTTCRGHYIFDNQIGDDMNPYHLPLLTNEQFHISAGLEPEIPMWEQDPVSLEMIRNHKHEC